MEDMLNKDKAQRSTSPASKDSYSRNEPIESRSLKDSEKYDSEPPDNGTKTNESSNEKDVEATVESSTEGADVVAKEDYSVFTVPQKRAIVFAGSFIAWFSPMTGAIYYPALDQVCVPRRRLNPVN